MIWVVLGVYLLGWLFAVRPALRRRMLQPVCRDCGSDGGQYCITFHRNYPRVIRGARSDRDGYDVSAAVWFALWWPFWLAALAVRRLAGLLGRAVIAATPLTPPELERRLAEQQKTIERLSAEIARDS